MTGDAIHDVGGIGGWLEVHAERRPRDPALFDMGMAESGAAPARLDYGALDARVNQLADLLAARGLRKGDRLAALMLNSAAFIETLFACAKLGAIFLPINFRLSPAEVLFILQDSAAHMIVYHAPFAPLVAPVRAQTGLLHGFYIGGETAPMPGDEPYEAALSAGRNRPPRIPVAQSDPHAMMYTSGTTGRPKGAVLTHGNTTWNAFNLLLSEGALSSEDVVLTVAPMFHIGGLNVHTLPALYKGARIVVQPRFDPAEALRAVEAERVTMMFLVPTMWLAISRLPDFDRYDLSSLRALMTGGAPTPLPLLEFFQSRGYKFFEGFGMTETAPNACFLAAKDAARKNGSVGKPLAHVRMRIVDEADRDVPQGEVGELVMRGPNLFIGYWNRPEATEEAFRNGWFHSGDLCRQDEEGFYYIVDRKKDMFISGGENVYPVEVEQVLNCHPKVSELALIGVPDEHWGEVGMLIVVPRAGEEITLAEMATFCEGKLAHFKVPRHIAVVDALPRNATGKVLKHMLRRQYGAAPAAAKG